MRKIITKVAGLILGVSMAFGVAVIGLSPKAKSVGASDTWNLTDFSSLATDDVVVIVDKTTSKAMSNNNGTSGAPSATDVTLSSDKSQISSGPASTLQWTVTKNADGTLSFGVGSSKLYCTATNNGVRVGSNSNNKFSINTEFLHNEATSRFLGVYNNQDWRCYTSINNNIKNTEIGFYKKTAEEGSPTLTVSPSSAHLLLNGSTTLTATALNGSGDVTWSVDEASVASISANSGSSISVTGESVGVATITASYSTADDVKIKVLVTAHYGTNSDPFSVADAKAAIDANGTVSEAYVSGLISQIDSYSSQYSSITYWISDDGTKSNQLEVYSGKGLNNVAFSSIDDVELQAAVTVFGNLKLYGTTYEFDKNNYLVSYSVSKVLSSISLSGGYPTQFEVGDSFSFEGLIVTATYSNTTTAQVTGFTISSPDMSIEGNKTVTVSYTEGDVTKEATYTINVVSQLLKWTITFYPGSGTGTMEPVEVIDGESYTLPACTFTAPEGYIFDGWTIDGTNIITAIESVTAHTSVTALWKVRPTEEPAAMTKGTNASDAVIKFSAGDEDKSGLKIGTGSAGGDFTLTVGEGAKSISFYAVAWKGSTGFTLTFTSNGVTFTPDSVTITANDGAASNSPFTLEGSEQEFKYVVNFTEVAAETDILVTASARIIVWDPVYSLNAGEVVTLSSISVDNPKIDYVLNEQFNEPTVIATYSDGSSKEVTGAVFTGFDSSSVTDSLQISVSYTENNVEAQTSYSISVSAPAPVADATYKKVETNLSNFSGDYLIVYEDESNDYAFDGSLSTLDATQNRVEATISEDKIDLSEAYEFHISAKEGGYSIQSKSGMYIGRTADSNGLDSNANDNYVNTISYNFGETNDMHVAGSGGAVLRYNSASNQDRFRFFKSSSYTGQKAISLYIQVADKAQELALDILNLTSPVCNAEQKDFTSAWSSLSTKWNALSTDEKSYLAEFKADANGTFVAEALARYDNICRTYGLAQFIEGRVVSASSNLVQGMNINSNSSTIIIVVVALTSITSIGVLLVIKRKRSLVK